MVETPAEEVKVKMPEMEETQSPELKVEILEMEDNLAAEVKVEMGETQAAEVKVEIPEIEETSEPEVKVQMEDTPTAEVKIHIPDRVAAGNLGSFFNFFKNVGRKTDKNPNLEQPTFRCIVQVEGTTCTGWSPTCTVECLVCLIKKSKPDLELVENLIETEADINVKDSDGNGLLSIACDKNLPSIALLLIEKGALCNGKNKFDWTPLMFACSNDLYSVTQKLLEKKKYSGEFCLTKEHIDMKEHINMEHVPDAHWRFDDLPYNRTALYCAIKANSTKCIHLLLERGASLYRGADDLGNLLPIKAEDFKIFLDRQVKFVDYNGEESLVKNSNDRLKLKYTFLKSKHNNETKILEAIISMTPDHQSLLKHPLVQVFLMMKWDKMKFFWSIWIAMKVTYFFQLLIMTWTMNGFTPNNCPSGDQAHIMKNATETLSMITNTRDTIYLPLYLYLPKILEVVIQSAPWFFSAFWIFFVLIEIGQCFADLGTWKREKKNLLQVLILILSGILMVTSEFSHGGQETYCNTNRHLLAFLFPMIYLEFLCELGYNPNLKVYISLFYSVGRTFVGYFAVYGLFLLTFALGFFLMLPPGEKNKTNGELGYPDNGWMLIPKIMVMFLGEQEFMEIPFLDGNIRIFEVAFYLIFLLLMVIILMNLLNALAVKDAGEMLDSAEMDKLTSLLSDATFWDQIIKENKSGLNYRLPKCIRSYLQKHLSVMRIFSEKSILNCEFVFKMCEKDNGRYNEPGYSGKGMDRYYATNTTISRKIVEMFYGIVFERNKNQNDEIKNQNMFEKILQKHEETQIMLAKILLNRKMTQI